MAVMFTIFALIQICVQKKDQKSVFLATDQYHVTASRAQVTSHQCDVFFTFSADKLSSLNGLRAQLEKDFFSWNDNLQFNCLKYKIIN